MNKYLTLGGTCVVLVVATFLLDQAKPVTFSLSELPKIPAQAANCRFVWIPLSDTLYTNTAYERKSRGIFFVDQGQSPDAGTPLAKADSATLEVSSEQGSPYQLFIPYARDKNYVFFRDQIVSGADPQTFQIPADENCNVSDVISGTKPIDLHADEIGAIAPTTNGFTYTSTKYGFTFSYPKGWYVGDNHIGWGTFQLFDTSLATRGSGGGKVVGSKIEAGICSGLSGYTLDTNDYPGMTVNNTNMRIANQAAIRSDVHIADGLDARAYSVRFPNSENTFCVTMYGPPSKFKVLDNLVESLEWIR